MIQRKSEFGGDGKFEQGASTQSDRNRHGGTPCECCGNEYDKPLEIVVDGISHYFDSFECAIEKLAPRFWNSTPVLFETIAEPKAWAIELMKEQTLRSLSTTVM